MEELINVATMADQHDVHLLFRPTIHDPVVTNTDSKDELKPSEFFFSDGCCSICNLPNLLSNGDLINFGEFP